MNLSTEQRDILCKVMASNLQLFRIKLGLSQEEFADRVGITRQSISAFETGQRKLPWNMFLAFLMLFSSNDLTKNLLKALEIMTPELEKFLN